MGVLSDQLEKYKKNLAFSILSAGNLYERRVHEIVAIKTGKLDKSISTKGPFIRGPIIEVQVGSFGVDYAIFVDQGVKGNVYNYHRNGNVVYVGVGQKFLERSFDDVEALIFKIIANTPTS